MSQLTIPEQDQLDCRHEALSDFKNPAPLAELPKASPSSFNPVAKEQFAPIPKVEALFKKIAVSMRKNPSPPTQLEPPIQEQAQAAPSPAPIPFSPEPAQPPQLSGSFPPPPASETVPLPSLSFDPDDAVESARRADELVKDHSYPIVSPFEPKSDNDGSLEDAPTLGTPPESQASPEEPLDAFTQPSGTDADLIEAILPIVESSLEKALYAPQTGLHTYLEPMLRNTVRRAIAEQMQTAHHFGQISATDRLTWRIKALFSSQTYDDIIFERTHRYQVEEVFLMRYDSLSLLSYASHDPSRHANPKKIRYDVSRLMVELKDADGELRKNFDLPDKRIALTRQGRNCFMLAIIRGRANVLVRADLDYTLEQIEQRFEKRLRKEGHHFVHALQPFLEGCLLIQSPPAPK